MRRELIKVSMIHSPESMRVVGSLAVESAMEAPWFMEEVNKACARLNLSRPVRAYFEGYGRPTTLVQPQPDTDLLPDIKPLITLASKGVPVVLERTEDQSLNLKRLYANRAIITTIEEASKGLGPEDDIPDEVWARYSPVYRRQLFRREILTDLVDRLIGGTIDRTLRPYEQGIVFVGAEHFPEIYISEDIKVDVLDERLHEYALNFLAPEILMREMILKGVDPGNPIEVSQFIQNLEEN